MWTTHQTKKDEQLSFPNTIPSACNIDYCSLYLKIIACNLHKDNSYWLNQAGKKTITNYACILMFLHCIFNRHKKSHLKKPSKVWILMKPILILIEIWDNLKQPAAILVLQYWQYQYFTSIFQYLQYWYRYW
jgi:hypothetical protein